MAAGLGEHTSESSDWMVDFISKRALVHSSWMLVTFEEDYSLRVFKYPEHPVINEHQACRQGPQRVKCSVRPNFLSLTWPPSATLHRMPKY